MGKIPTCYEADRSELNWLEKKMKKSQPSSDKSENIWGKEERKRLFKSQKWENWEKVDSYSLHSKTFIHETEIAIFLVAVNVKIPVF